MEERKRKEIEYYDEQVKYFGESSLSTLGSFRFLYRLAAPLCEDKKVLDYGCGSGAHTGFLAQHANEVVGIDLSEASLKVAEGLSHKRDDRQGSETGQKVRFLKMDCEALKFPNGSFDVVFDGGTFSSLDFHKALAEITRVLEPNGVLVGIETFGHNPLANLTRIQ